MFQRPDGVFELRARVGQQLFDWITVREAAKLIARDVSKCSVYRLIEDEFLVYRKPLKGKVEVSSASVCWLRDATNDPEFWDRKDLQERLRRRVRQSMRKLAESALQ